MKIQHSFLTTTAFCAFIGISVLFSGCKKDDDNPESENHNESELITTLQMQFTDSAGTTSTFSFFDPDGPGGNAPTLDTIRLDASQDYNLSISVLDESDPADTEDITVEIMEEAEDHLFCFSHSLPLDITITDTDANGLPLGLLSTWNIMDGGSGSVTVVLRHQPEVKNGTCTVGEVDIEVAFPVIMN